MRLAACESAKRRAWASEEIDDRKLVHDWRTQRRDLDLQTMSESEIFPRSTKKHHRQRLFQQCMLALWKHECRMPNGETEVSQALQIVAEQLGDRLVSQLREILLCAYPVGWKLDERASWAEKRSADDIRRCKKFVTALHTAAIPFVRHSAWRREMANRSLEVLKLPLIELDSPSSPAAEDATEVTQPTQLDVQMPILPSYLRENPLHILLYHPLELHKPQVLREIAAVCSNEQILRAKNLLYHIGYADSKYDEKQVTDLIEKNVRKHFEASVPQDRPERQEAVRTAFEGWVARRQHRFNDLFRHGFPYENDNRLESTAFLQRFRVNQYLMAIYRHARLPGPVSSSIEALGSLDLARIDLSVDMQRDFVSSGDLDVKLGVLFEHFHTAQDQLSAKASLMRDVVVRRQWLASDAAWVVECLDRKIKGLTHPGPKASSFADQRRSTLDGQAPDGEGPTQQQQQQKRNRATQEQSPGQALGKTGSGKGRGRKKRRTV